MKQLILLFSLFYSTVLFSQGEQDSKKQFSFYWGYNRSAYTLSSLQIEGEGYNYTLKDVIAHDRPSAFSPDVYFNLSKISVPQFNTRIGYQWKEKWAISFGYDHMKYVVDQDQKVAITGTIETEKANQYIGTYTTGDSVVINNSFLTFEHTDGLNYFAFELDHVLNLFNLKDELITAQLRPGFGLGFLIPRTDVKIFGEKGPNIFNFAGYGTSLKTELRVQFKKHFFIQATGKAGYINMPHISTTRKKEDKASQQFGFIEGFWAIGTSFYL